MSKEEIIIELVKSLNMGNSNYYGSYRIDIAIHQYNRLVEEGIIPKEDKTKV